MDVVSKLDLKNYAFLKAGSFKPSVALWVEEALQVNGDELLNLGSVYVNQKRIDKDTSLSCGDIVRVHHCPRRYRGALRNWRTHILDETDHFIVVDKPSGVPVHATVDNKVENVAHQLSLFLGYPLFVTQRLDVATGGLLVIAKSARFQSAFNRQLMNRKVNKKYWALSNKALAPGLYQHGMLPSKRQPREIVAADSENVQLCELRVLDCKEIENKGYRHSIELLTGRTHQIRAQLAYLGAPVTGDSLYDGRKVTQQPEAIALLSQQLWFLDPLDTHISHRYKLNDDRWQNQLSICLESESTAIPIAPKHHK